MEVTAEDWITKAIDNVDLYLHRGGECKGNEPEYLGGVPLYNTIGAALSLRPDDPLKWSSSQLEMAKKGQLCYYSGDAKKAIVVIADKISENCGGNASNYIVVLPIELYQDGKLYEIPLFRFRRNHGDDWMFVDNIGRVYKSFEDWFENNHLPPCHMLYPKDGQLSLKPGCTHAWCVDSVTPAGRPASKVAIIADYAALGVGLIGGFGAIILSGGAALPFVVAGIASAVYGTGRATYQIVDRGLHDESINPFTNSEARLLWLGIAANCISFGAMGASFRLTSLAVRGKDISTSFKIIVNTLNGTSFAVNTSAIINSTVYLYENRENISQTDILLQCISIAFWTKSVAKFQTANQIIRTSQDSMYKQFTKNMPAEKVEQFNGYRSALNDDAKLLRFLHLHNKEGKIGPVSVIGLLAELHGELGEGQRIQINSDGTINIGTAKFSIDMLNKVPANVRPVYFNILASLASSSSQDIAVLREINDTLKTYMNVHVAEAIVHVSSRFNMAPKDVMKEMINFWRELQNSRGVNSMPRMELTGEGNLIIGNGHSFRLNQIAQLTNPEHILAIHRMSTLSPSATTTFNQLRAIVRNDTVLLTWIGRAPDAVGANVVPNMLTLYNNGLGTVCPFQLLNEGHVMVSLNSHLRVSIRNLLSKQPTDQSNIFAQVKTLPSDCNSNVLASKYESVKKLCVEKFRFRFEFQRSEAANWFPKEIRKLCKQPHEQDRLFTMMTRASEYEPPLKTSDNEVVKFALWMRPETVSEFASYMEFCLCCIDDERRIVSELIVNGKFEGNRVDNVTEFKVKKAYERLFHDINKREKIFGTLKLKFEEYRQIVKQNNLVGTSNIQPNLEAQELITAVRKITVRFGSEISAAYHICKHPVDNYATFLDKLQECIRSADVKKPPKVDIGQDGTSRSITFQNKIGRAIIIEINGRVFLATFMPFNKK